MMRRLIENDCGIAALLASNDFSTSSSLISESARDTAVVPVEVIDERPIPPTERYAFLILVPEVFSACLIACPIARVTSAWLIMYPCRSPLDSAKPVPTILEIGRAHV